MPKVILDIKLYTVEEVAEMLGISYQTCNKYIGEGRMAYQVMGGKRYISEQNIKDFLMGSKQV